MVKRKRIKRIKRQDKRNKPYKSKVKSKDKLVINYKSAREHSKSRKTHKVNKKSIKVQNKKQEITHKVVPVKSTVKTHKSDEYFEQKRVEANKKKYLESIQKEHKILYSAQIRIEIKEQEYDLDNLGIPEIKEEIGNKEYYANKWLTHFRDYNGAFFESKQESIDDAMNKINKKIERCKRSGVFARVKGKPLFAEIDLTTGKITKAKKRRKITSKGDRLKREDDRKLKNRK